MHFQSIAVEVMSRHGKTRARRQIKALTFFSFFYFIFFFINPSFLAFHPYGCPSLGLLALSSAQGAFLHAAACAGRRPRALHPGPKTILQITNYHPPHAPTSPKPTFIAPLHEGPFPVHPEVSIYSSHKTHVLGVGLAKVLTMPFCRMTHPCPAQWWSNPISKHLLWQ